jgi:hypothetical protein
MRFVLILLFTAFAVMSCRKGKDTPQDIIIDSISPAFFVKQTRPYATAEVLSGRSKFAYIDGKPVKRSGAVVSIFSFEVTDKVFDTVIYVNNNNLIIESRLNIGQNPAPYKWEVTLQNGLPVKRISYLYRVAEQQYIIADTTYYSYNTKNQIEKIESHSTVFPYSYLHAKQFTFNAAGNLVKVNTTYTRKPAQLQYTAVEELSMYDNAKNPLQRFWIWDDLYYRSVSANNFAKYNYVRYDQSNNPVEIKVQVIPLKYDANGSILFFP